MQPTIALTSLPNISIIIPSYNQGQYLPETIRSIIAQGYSNYELIIIDGGSTDDTLDVIRHYHSHITYWVSEPDRGQSHAIQKGLAQATGDIINWINSDDLMAPGAFEHIVAVFDLHKYDVVCGYCHYFINDIAHLDLRNERMGLQPTVGETMLHRQINQPSTYFKASVFRALGVNERFHFTMDLDLWYRYLLQAGQSRVLLTDSLLSYFRLHESSKTMTSSFLFEAEAAQVFYNVLYSMGQPQELLAFAQRSIPEAKFAPTRYPVKVPAHELRSLARFYAWEALIFYNQTKNRSAARVCLRIARQNNWPLGVRFLRQWLKHYALPSRLLP